MGTQGTSSNTGRASRERELGLGIHKLGGFLLHSNKKYLLFVCLNQMFCKFRFWIPPWAQFGSAHPHSRGSPDAHDPTCLPERLRCPWRARDTGMAQNVPFLWAWPRKGWAPPSHGPISWGQLCTAPNPPAPRGLPKSLLHYKSYGIILV